MLTLSKSNWLAKIYLFNFHWTPSEPDYPLTDLCHFMRVILIWLPLKFIVVSSLLALGIVWFDELWWPITAIIMSVIAAVGGGVLVLFLVTNCSEKLREFDTIKVFIEAVEAKKRKVCPLIEFE